MYILYYTICTQNVLHHIQCTAPYINYCNIHKIYSTSIAQSVSYVPKLHCILHTGNYCTIHTQLYTKGSASYTQCIALCIHYVVHHICTQNVLHHTCTQYTAHYVHNVFCYTNCIVHIYMYTMYYTTLTNCITLCPHKMYSIIQYTLCIGAY